MKRNAKTVTKVLGPAPGYYDPEQVRQRQEILAITERDAEWKCEGFADMVVQKGFKAVGPPAFRDGPPRSWQTIGRTLFGEERFNRHLKAALERKHAVQQASQPAR